ncbi:hypothetical protein NBG4_490003 [Candidatus Sulfobium mesophilum]|uniref:Uncharacterized protein n=1 Tax=Candidatus Sulfobium mesophilum TaxID=2016548 RepID=A0A2U3QIL0_9BACT|nr:hypothetical protein NBG4_490003 [Candidatus Sulfobium mesophilum]
MGRHLHYHPLPEYYMLSLSDNGDPASNPTGSYQITGMDKDHTLSATFAEYMVKRIYSRGTHMQGPYPRHTAV